MRVLVDMNLSPSWARLLSREVYEALHWSSVGAGDDPDTTIMAFARAGGFVVLTHDLDFGAILAATGGAKPSVVQIRAEDVSPSAIGRQVLAALGQVARELEEGALLTVEIGRARLRLLPLSPHS
jgi:predicted nuclease of predicted toxin-antitoxin system